MSVRDFKSIKPNMGGIPIIGGGGLPPAQIRDALGRVLQPGDFVILETVNSQQFHVKTIQPVVDPAIPPGTMEITLSSTVRFLASRDQPNVEFLRVMTREEVEVHQVGRLPIDPPSVEAVAPPHREEAPADERPTLKDA